MGVPKFFRWLSERYPKINQRAGFLPEEDTCMEHFGKLPPPPLIPPDPLSTCGLSPPIDRLYIDMNGIIHGCSHNNGTTPQDLSQQDIFRNVAYYLDRVIGDIVQPTELVYMSIDGVAPRAKLNQQRSRRYRSGNEGEIEETIYEAHLHRHGHRGDDDDDDTVANGSSSFIGGGGSSEVMMQDHRETLEEVEPGRFTGKFESHAIQVEESTAFHHNEITPGTPFFQACTDFLHSYIRQKVASDPKWQHLTVIFSGPDVPGEGEHKIMDFIRRERVRTDYDANTKHCIMGQDGDWMMLGLATHEPNLVLLREQVIFEASKRVLVESNGIDSYIHNANFEWLHLSILRDYLAYEFETRQVVPTAPYELEPTIDDFVFLTFFVGNDFLPHMPALDIADEAFDLIFHVYRKQRKAWQKERKKIKHPYLTNAGNIVSGLRLEKFVAHLGQHELPYYDNKKRDQSTVLEALRRSDSKAGRQPTIPDDEVLERKEEFDRAKYREMLQSIEIERESDVREFSPVLSEGNIANSFQPSMCTREDDEVEEGLVNRIGSLLQFSIKGNDDDGGGSPGFAAMNDQDLKGRYYYDKFGFTPFDAEKHIALRKAYVEGLVWNLKYYYEGCVSWDWYYPYHYGPMLSDLANIDEILKEVRFDDPGEPLRPFEQLMGCMPPSSAHLLPEPYRWLLTESSSPLIDFYPRTFTVDMNGKRWPWEAVVLLPFIDAKSLTDASRNLVREDLLTDEEKKRNVCGKAWVIARDIEDEGDMTEFMPLESSEWDYHPEERAVLKPELMAGVVSPCPGFPTLKEAPIRSLWHRNVGVNVFGMRSRYRTALLVLGEVLPTTPPIEVLGEKLIGTTIFLNYPFLSEAFVTAISDSQATIRGVGHDNFRRWDANESLFFRQKASAIKKNQAFGEKLTGTGGWMMPDSDIVVSARPLKGLKMLPDGSKAKLFAKFEVDLPLTAAIWVPSYEDPRLSNAPALLEKDPYSVVMKEKKQETAPTLLLPDYEEQKSTAPASIDSVLPEMPEADPYSPPFLLPSFEDQDPPIMHPLNELLPENRQDQTSSTDSSRLSASLLPPEEAIREERRKLSDSQEETSIPLLPPHRRVKKARRRPRNASTSPLLPKDRRQVTAPLTENTDEASAPLLPPDFTSVASRGFATCSSRQRKYRSANTGTKRSFGTAASRMTLLSTTHRAAVAGTNSRFRLLAFGAATAAAAVAFNAGNVHALHNDKSLAVAYAVRGGHAHEFDGSSSTFNKNSLWHDDDVRATSSHPPPLEFAHGTTTLSFTFDGGVVAAVDSRASLGNFVGSKTTQKVLPIDSHLLGTMAGGAADCMFWIRKIKAEALLYKLSERRPMSVSRASQLLAGALYQNRALQLSVGTMIMGYDVARKRAQIYYVDNTGARIPGDMFAVGSGSTFAYAILDVERRKDMTREEAIALGIKAIRHATFRDSYSGGYINVYVIDKDGWKRVFSEDVAAQSPSCNGVRNHKDETTL